MADPQVDEIVLRFQNLRSKSSRRAVYLSLLDELRNDEVREVKARVDQKDFHVDILGGLPLEVAAQVASHLDVTEVVYLQVVGVSWGPRRGVNGRMGADRMCYRYAGVGDTC